MLQRWLFIPGFCYLVLVFASGTWLRWQWYAPDWTIFHPGFLTHAHSHVAVLGWAFCMLCGLLFRYAIHWERIPKTAFRITMALLHFSVIGMAVTFTLQGYGGWSIGFSTLHLLVGYAIAVFYFRYEIEELPSVLRNFYSAAIWWLVISTLGPWLLAFGPAMPSFWMDAGIEFYLHTQFNGWLTFGVLGLALHYFHRRGGELTWLTHLGFAMLLIGTLPALIPMLDQTQINQNVAIAGAAGSLLYAIGGIIVAVPLIKMLVTERSAPIKGIMILSGGALLIKQIMLGIIAFPAVAEAVMDYSFVVVGYLHMLLLGFISSALLYGWLQLIRVKTNLPFTMSLTAYLAGVGVMLLLLLWFGAVQIFGMAPYIPVQLSLFVTALIALIGSMGLLVKAAGNWSG